MPRVPFDQLPDHARLWIFGADRPLSLDERRLLAESVENGLRGWSAHGSPVTWGHALHHERFLLLGVDESTTALSGCSIDGAVHEIQALERRLGPSLLDTARVFYREGEGVRAVSRQRFRELADAGAVSAETVVYNNVIATVGDLRRGAWEVPASRSWHAKAFPLRAE